MYTIEMSAALICGRDSPFLTFPGLDCGSAKLRVGVGVAFGWFGVGCRVDLGLFRVNSLPWYIGQTKSTLVACHQDGLRKK